MKVAVVKYNAGNIFSVVHALERMGVEPILTDSAEELRSADKVIFPGQGEASSAMHYLREHGLDRIIPSLTQPVLGIFDVDVKRFQPRRHEDKIPHMGWNSLQVKTEELRVKSEESKLLLASDCYLNSSLFTLRSSLLEGTPFVYFVHSYYVPVCESTIAVTEYIHPFSAAMQKDNFYATQFHPEKSGAVGQQILRNFLEMKSE